LGRENEQHSFGADYVNDRTGEVEATFPIMRGRTLRVTKEELQNLRQCIQEESAQSITTAQRHPIIGRPPSTKKNLIALLQCAEEIKPTLLKVLHEELDGLKENIGKK